MLTCKLDFDPNQDSPVEILHVVLLGVVKYWWRDAVSRQTAERREELRVHLKSVDVTGLGCSKLRGKTDNARRLGTKIDCMRKTAYKLYQWVFLTGRCQKCVKHKR